MGYYKVNFDSLDTVYQNISGQAALWSEKMETLSSKMTALSESKNMSGATADAIRSYLNSVHGTIIGVLGQLILLHTTNLLIYKTEYQSDIDADLHAVIDTAEVDDIQDLLAKKKALAISVDENVAYALGQISDIFSIGYRDVTSVSEAHTNAVVFLKNLCDSIEQLEQNHVASDFSSTQELISSLTAFINERLNNKRDFSSFTEAELSSSASFLGLYNAYLAASDDLQGKSEAIERAYEIENTRMESLQEEYEERERKAQTFKWIVTAACVVGSVVAIAATGGAATPLVVGAISACSGAIIAGASAGADQYVEHGWSASQWDWGAIGKDALVGGVSGFVTGYLGASVSGAITSSLGTTSVGSTLLNSSNAAVRIGTGVVIGSVSEVWAGIISRGAGAFVSSGGDLEATKDAAFDGKSILTDVAIGGVSGGIAAAKNPVGKKIDVDDVDKELLQTKPKNSPKPQRWIEEGGGQIRVDGNGTWTYTNSEGVSVCYTNDYPDFKRAGLVEDAYTVEHGFNTSNHSVDIKQAQSATGKGTKGSNMTWHHNEDGKTLQLVPREYHEQFRHRGGFSLAKGG